MYLEDKDSLYYIGTQSEITLTWILKEEFGRVMHLNVRVKWSDWYSVMKITVHKVIKLVNLRITTRGLGNFL